MIGIKCVIVILVWAVSGAVGASDLDKEKRWADQIVDALFDGEPVYLDDGRSEFLAIETPSEDGSTAKAAVIMHGTGVHPDWPTVVSPLRVRLPQSGWHTLSIQMPVLGTRQSMPSTPRSTIGRRRASMRR